MLSLGFSSYEIQGGGLPAFAGAPAGTEAAILQRPVPDAQPGGYGRPHNTNMDYFLQNSSVDRQCYVAKVQEEGAQQTGNLRSRIPLKKKKSYKDNRTELTPE